MKNYNELKQLAMAIKEHGYNVNEYSQDGKLRKRMFENTGKRAMKEVRRSLKGIKSYFIDFNRGMPHESGTLSLRLYTARKISLAIEINISHFRYNMCIDIYEVNNILTFDEDKSIHIVHCCLYDYKFSEFVSMLNSIIENGDYKPL